MKLRYIKEDDKDMIFNLRNMDKIVALSSSQRKVDYDEHSKWFSRIIRSDNAVAFIIENNIQYQYSDLLALPEKFE